MTFRNNQDFLKDSEKEFLWSIALDEDHAALKSFEKNPKLDNIINYSINNRIEKNLYCFLKKKNLLNEIDDENISAIKSSIEIRTKKSLATYYKAIKILHEFTTEGITYVSLKGISYLEYSNTFERPIRDIDVLVAFDDIEKAVEIALKNGFRFQNHNKFSNNMIVDNSDVYDLPDLIDENNVCLEIHYKILRDSKLSRCELSNFLFESAKSFSIHGKNIKSSNLSSCISHLIYHTSKKGNFDIGLVSIFDLKFLSKFTSLDDLKEIQRISDKCGFGLESESFLEIIKSKKSSKSKSYLIKELIFSPNLNIKIQEFFLKKSSYQKLKYIFNSLFVSKKLINREFQRKKGFLVSNYFARWKRQFNQFNSYIYLLIFKREVFKRRSKLINKFYEKN